MVINGLYRSEPVQNLNDVPTIQIDEGCNIERLLLTNIMQFIPEDKQLIFQHENSHVGTLLLNGAACDPQMIRQINLSEKFY